MYDSTTHAMTEVALGLSMAFFSLMILALLSFQLPKQGQVNISEPLAEAEKIRVSSHSASNAGQKAESGESESNPRQESNSQSDYQFGFYYQGRLWDKQLNEISLNSFSPLQPVVIAVPKNESFDKVMSLRQQINHANLFITTLDEQWQQTLEQM